MKDANDTINEDISPTSLLSLLPMISDLSSFSLELNQEVGILIGIYILMYL